MLLTTIEKVGGDTHSITIFLEFSQRCSWKWFFKQKFKYHFGHIIIFSPTITISLSIIIEWFKFEILIFGQQMKMDINNFEFIYLPIMDDFIQWFIDLTQIINDIHPCKMIFIHMKSFIYGHIHPCR